MSVEQIQYEEDILRVSFRDRRIYGEADHYYDGVVPYSQIPTLRTYNPQWEQQWEDAVNEGASTSTTYQDFWIPQVEQHIRASSAESVGGFRLGQIAQRMIQGYLQVFNRSKTICFSDSQFCLVV